MTGEHLVDGRGRSMKDCADHLRARAGDLSDAKNLRLGGGIQSPGAAVWAAGAAFEGRPGSGAKTRKEAVDGGAMYS